MNKKKLKKRDLVNKINLVVRFKPRNTILSVTTKQKGHVIFWESGGSCGFKGSRKRTPATLFTISEKVSKRLRTLLGCFSINIILYGKVRIKPVVKGLKYNGIKVSSFKDMTNIPHNGVSFSKKRRKKKRKRQKRSQKFIKLITDIKKPFMKKN